MIKLRETEHCCVKLTSYDFVHVSTFLKLTLGAFTILPLVDIGRKIYHWQNIGTKVCQW